MCGLKFQIISFLFLLGPSGEVSAADKVWTGGTGDSSWHNGANWNGGTVPLSSQTVAIDLEGSIAEIADSDVICSRVNVGVSHTNVLLNITSGRTLNTGTSGLYVGVNAGSEGAVVIDQYGSYQGAKIDVGDSGSGQLYLMGGDVDLTGYLNVPRYGGDGFVSLEKGSLEALNIYMGTWGGTGSMDVRDGELVVQANQLYRLGVYTSNEYITAFGNSGEGMLEVDYNETHSGKTTLRATSLDYGFAIPTNLYLVSPGETGTDALTTIQTLSGIVAQDRPEIWIMGAGTHMWATNLCDQYNIPLTWVHDVASGTVLQWLLAHYSDRYSGYILYDYDNNPVSRTVATSLAGVLKAVAVDVDIEGPVRDNYGLSKILDVTGKDHQWMEANYGDAFRHNALMILEPDRNNQDWCTALGMMNIWDDDTNWVEGVLSSVVKNSPVYGWANPAANAVNPYDEDAFIRLHSEHDLYQVPGGSLFNLPVHAAMWGAVSNLNQNVSVSSAAVTNRHHVTFIVNGMANLIYLLNSNSWAEHTNRWASPYRGDFPIGWVMAMPTVKLAPTVAEWFYNNAVSEMDNFVCAYSGLGYTHPSALTDGKKTSGVLDTYLQKADIKTVFIKDLTNLTANTAKIYTETESVRGGFCNTGNANYDGSIRWYDDVPFVNLRASIREGTGLTGLEVADLVNGLALTNSPGTAAGYSAFYLDVESRGVADLNEAMEHINTNTVRVVTPEEFIEQIRLNCAQ